MNLVRTQIRRVHVVMNGSRAHMADMTALFSWRLVGIPENPSEYDMTHPLHSAKVSLVLLLCTKA